MFGDRGNSKTLDCIGLDDYYCDDSEYEYFDGRTETHVSESAEDLEDASEVFALPSGRYLIVEG